MEEAEALCTRLGIMVSGTLRCLGGGQHLRSVYARHYQIEVSLVQGDTGARRRLLALMEAHCPGMRLLEEQPPQMRFEVPLQAPDGFIRNLSWIFSFMQENKDMAGVANYSVSQTSLEQIFNSFAKKQEEEKLLSRAQEGAIVTVDQNHSPEIDGAVTQDPSKS